MHSRTESASSVGCLGAVHDASLKKLMKDLHRCEVSISRYQTMLNEVENILFREYIYEVNCLIFELSLKNSRILTCFTCQIFFCLSPSWLIANISSL